MSTRVKETTKNTDEKPIDVDWKDRELVALLQGVEAVLDANRYLCGDALTLADFAVAGMTSYFGKCEFPFSTFPAIGAWFDRINNLPALKSTEDPLWSQQ